MIPQPRHRPTRRFPHAERWIFDCPFEVCPHCGELLHPRQPWHMRKTVQTLQGPRFIAGKSKECLNALCPRPGSRFYAPGVLRVSLPSSTYGLDVLAFIGWQHEHEHRQLIEILQELNQRGVVVNERNVGKLYRQFLALLGGLTDRKRERLAQSARQHGGVIWAVDALQPEGHGTLLYLLYEVLSETPVGAIQLDHPTAAELNEWLKPYQAWPDPVLGTLSDGEEAIRAALKSAWPEAPHQLCQLHFLGNLAAPVIEVDTRLRKQMKHELGGLPKVPEETLPEETLPEETLPEETLPEETLPEETLPEETIPEETIPEETIPEETIPEETIPEETIPEESPSETLETRGSATEVEDPPLPF
jgi:hypothetical protein